MVTKLRALRRNLARRHRAEQALDEAGGVEEIAAQDPIDPDRLTTASLSVMDSLPVVRSIFTGIAPVDTAGTIAAAGALTFAMLTAAVLPARRAARLDLVQALRHE